MSTKAILFDPEDPRLTAYALGELTDPAERAQVEQLLAASPEARAELSDIRALTAELTAEYEQERDSAPASELPANVVPMLALEPKDPSILRRLAPWLSLAAMFMVVVGLAMKLGLAIRPQSAVISVANSLQRGSAKAIRNDARIVDGRIDDQQVTNGIVATPASPLFAQRKDEKAAEAGKQLALNEPVTLAMPAVPAAAEPSVTGTVNGQPTARAKNGQDFLSANVSAAKPLGQAGGSANGGTLSNPLQGPVTYTGSVTGAAGQIAVSGPVVSRHGMVADFSTMDGRAAPKSAPPLLALNKAKAPPAPATAFEMAEPAPSAPVMSEPEVRKLVAPSEDSDKEAYRATPDRGRASIKEDPRQSNTADYTHAIENAFLAAKENPLSTFSIDVDTASYSIARRFIESGSLPPPDAVRVEEMLNYFPYSDAPPAPGNDKPFAIHLEAAACPWNTAHRLVRIGIKGREIDTDKRPASNLVFLLDVSGSMMPEERLPLIKQSLHLMVEKLREDDHVAIVVYAGESGLALASTSGDHKDAILHAIDNLHAGGSTNGASGIKLAYQVARKGFIKGGTNRVILATDGDFNVGVTSRGSLLRLIEEERKDGVFLSVLGVGTDNLKDSTMQTLADHGNGNYAYIDRLEEGRKVLVEQMSGTLVTIAKDVKIQVEFNPAAAASYRLIGYEKRMLKKEDFNNDLIDAGEIGAGHSVTALYEVVPVGQPVDGTGTVDALKYQPPAPDLRPTGSAPVRAVAEDAKSVPEGGSRELLTVKMRHKAPDSDKSERSYEEALTDHGAPGEYGNATPDFKFAAAVASFGLVLRDSPYKGSATLGSALELAQEGKGEDPGGHRAGFIDLVRRAQALQDVRR